MRGREEREAARGGERGGELARKRKIERQRDGDIYHALKIQTNTHAE
jgi:hypothetical protein